MLSVELVTRFPSVAIKQLRPICRYWSSEVRFSQVSMCLTSLFHFLT